MDEYTHIWGFPKMKGTIVGVPIIRTLVYWGLYCVLPILENYHMCIYIYTYKILEMVSCQLQLCLRSLTAP